MHTELMGINHFIVDMRMELGHGARHLWVHMESSFVRWGFKFISYMTVSV